MVHRWIETTAAWLKRVIRQPREELDRWQRAARFAYDLGRFGARQLRYDRAPQMAAALAFRALFGLVPVLVVATVLVRAVIGIDEFLDRITDVLAWAQLDNVKIVNPAGATIESQTLSEWLGDLVGEAANIKLSAIGWVGLLVVIYAATGLLATIENAFNIIYRASDGRAWVRRVPLYWFLLTVSPIAIGLAAWMNGQFELYLTMIDAWPWAMMLGRMLWSGLFGWLLMLTVYLLIPNTNVEFRPAAIGGLVAVIILEVGKRLLGVALQNAFAISELYGSLGLIPLFMFWIYLMWLAVLFGLQVSATLQMLHGRRLEEIERTRELTGLIEPASLISVMELVANRFARGDRTTADQIAEAVSMPRDTVREIIDRLIVAGLLHRIDRDADSVCLSRPPDQIETTQLLNLGFRMIDESGVRPSTFFNRLRDAQRSLTDQQTLAAVLEQLSAKQQS